MKRELIKIFVASSAIYFGFTFIASGFGVIFGASLTRHSEPDQAHLLSDETAITGTVPFQRVAADEFRVKMDTDRNIIYLNRH